MSSLLRTSLIAGLFWNLMGSCKHERGAMLVGSASRGGAGRGAQEGKVERTGLREGKEEMKEHKCLRLVWKRTGQNAQTDTSMHARTATPCLIGTSPKPRWGLQRPLVGGAPLGQHGAVTHPSPRTKGPLLLPCSLPSLLFQFMSLKQNRTEAQKK